MLPEAGPGEEGRADANGNWRSGQESRCIADILGRRFSAAAELPEGGSIFDMSSKGARIKVAPQPFSDNGASRLAYYGVHVKHEDDLPRVRDAHSACRRN